MWCTLVALCGERSTICRQHGNKEDDTERWKCKKCKLSASEVDGTRRKDYWEVIMWMCIETGKFL